MVKGMTNDHIKNKDTPPMRQCGLSGEVFSAIITLSRWPCTLPTRAAFELVIHLKTAEALGLTILELLLTCIN